MNRKQRFRSLLNYIRKTLTHWSSGSPIPLSYRGWGYSVSLHGGLLSRNKGGVFCVVYFDSEACWIKSVWCLTWKNRMFFHGGFKENEGSFFRNQKMFYPEGLKKVCLFDLTGEK